MKDQGVPESWTCLGVSAVVVILCGSSWGLSGCQVRRLVFVDEDFLSQVGIEEFTCLRTVRSICKSVLLLNPSQFLLREIEHRGTYKVLGGGRLGATWLVPTVVDSTVVTTGVDESGQALDCFVDESAYVVQMEATVTEDPIQEFETEIPTQTSRTSMKEVVEASIAAGTLKLAGVKRRSKSERIANKAKAFKFGKDGAGSSADKAWDVDEVLAEP
ncbi:hypothetical protein Tco_1502941 [Tanacetum coccineum]